MKVAVIGSGVSGLGAAYALSEIADVRLFEKDARFGGHSNTVDVDYDGASIAVDTGFIVFNERNYPNLCGLLGHLGVASKPSDMSFGFSLEDGALEYACDDLDKIFAQRRNILNPRFLWTFREVLRFCRAAPRDIASGATQGRSLGEWLEWRGFSDWFRNRFILPMGGAIWSTPTDRMMAFPADNFLKFFANHDLYTGLDKAMTWRTVEGGSREYVSRVVRALGTNARAGLGAVSVDRSGPMPRVRFDDGSEGWFDAVILACHGPDAARLLTDKDAEENDILGAFRASRNRAVLHRDPRLMPSRRKVWSSWTLMSQGPQDEGRPVSVSYWMNRLQGLDPARDLFVSLNPHIEPEPDKVFARFDYAHPLYDEATFAAQARLPEIQGRGGVWHAGAWTGFGFHEDGLRSGLRAAMALGARPSWAVEPPPRPPSGLAVAAE